MPKVSIIVTAYNIDKYIKKCIESILSQTFNSIEIIIVDDGSTDNTYKILSENYSRNNRVNLIKQENQGVQRARQKGIDSCNGEYILLVDGDDWLENNAIEKLYSKAKKDKADIVYYTCFYIRNEQKIECEIKEFNQSDKSEYLRQLLLGNIQPGLVLKFIKNQFIEKNNIKFTNGLRYGEDLATSVLLATNNPIISYIHDPLYNYVKRNESATNLIDDRVFDIVKVADLIEKYLRKNDLYNKNKEAFELMLFKHLYVYRVIEPKYNEKYHSYFYNTYKNMNIDIESNKYYINYFKSMKFRNKIKLCAYNKSFIIGKIFSIILDNIKKIYVRLIKIFDKM